MFNGSSKITSAVGVRNPKITSFEKVSEGEFLKTIFWVLS